MVGGQLVSKGVLRGVGKEGQEHGGVSGVRRTTARWRAWRGHATGAYGDSAMRMRHRDGNMVQAVR